MRVWEVDDEVDLIALLCSGCYAMLVDVDWLSVSMTDVRFVN